MAYKKGTTRRSNPDQLPPMDPEKQISAIQTMAGKDFQLMASDDSNGHTFTGRKAKSTNFDFV